MKRVIYAGATYQTFNLQSDFFTGLGGNVDLQLALFGLVNQILNYLLENAIEHAVAVIITVWLVCTYCCPKIPIRAVFTSSSRHSGSILRRADIRFWAQRRVDEAMDCCCEILAPNEVFARIEMALVCTLHHLSPSVSVRASAGFGCQYNWHP